MVQTIANPDGTVSIIHVDPNNPVITLPDGTTAQVQGVAQIDQGVHTLAEVASQHSSLDVGHATTGELQENGHIIITSDDGHAYPFNGMITVPVSAGTYQAVVASMSQSGNITFHNATETAPTLTSSASNSNSQIIGTPIILANGQILTKVESEEKSSIHNLVSKVMGQQNLTNDVKPATLTITPVTSAAQGPIIQMVGSNSVASTSGTSRSLRNRDHHQDQPDTTESLD